MRAIRLYTLFTVFIALWWAVTLLPTKKSCTLPKNLNALSTPIVKARCPLFDKVSVINRQKLLKALNGDIKLIIELIREWDIDAQILEQNQVTGIKRLTSHEYLQSQLLKRVLEKSDYPPSKTRYLPQTYVAASFLTALLDASQIIAFPKGLNSCRHLFPTDKIANIPLDIDLNTTEKLLLNPPDIAFVSHYSNPSTVGALKRKGIKIYTLPQITSINSMKNALVHLGHIVNRPFNAELLTLFIDAALYSIDNRIALLKHELPELFTTVNYLYLTSHHSLATPTAETLTYKLLSRLEITPCLTNLTENNWSISLEQEEIANFNPHILFLSTQEPEALLKRFLSSYALQNLTAIEQKNLFFLDEAVQQFPSQFLILAYYDLMDALCHATLP